MPVMNAFLKLWILNPGPSRTISAPFLYFILRQGLTEPPQQDSDLRLSCLGPSRVLGLQVSATLAEAHFLILRPGSKDLRPPLPSQCPSPGLICHLFLGLLDLSLRFVLSWTWCFFLQAVSAQSGFDFRRQSTPL